MVYATSDSEDDVLYFNEPRVRLSNSIVNLKIGTSGVSK